MPLTEESIVSIVAIADVAVRNLWITQSYADLAQRLLDVYKTDQTWCSFAVWASNTAGISIRGDELPSFITSLLLGADPHIDAIITKTNACTQWLAKTGLIREFQRSHLEHLVARAVAQVSAFIANGNSLVYGELAPLFVRLIDYLQRHERPKLETIDETLDELGVPSTGDHPLVRQAFRHYLIAAGATDAGATNGATRAEHILSANVAAVLHEQQRLQHDIESALNIGLVDFGDDLRGLAHGALSKELLRPVIHEVRVHITPHLEDLWQHVATRLLMTMSVPGETLHVDRDVPLSPGEDHLFPSELEHVREDDLRELLAEWDPTAGTGHGSGARDWAKLDQRMGYIVNLFRSRQQALQLTTPPFTSEQLSWIYEGVLPPAWLKRNHVA